MKKAKLKFFLLHLFFSLCLSGLFAQTNTNNPELISTEFEMTGSPQWAKDLRRAEIIAFGSFPLMYLATNTIYSNAAPVYNQAQRFRSIGIAAGGAILIALVDYSIVMIKRKKAEKEIRDLPPGAPIIIRTPMDGEKSEEAPPEEEGP